MSGKVFTEVEGRAINAVLDTLKAEVQNATLDTPAVPEDPLAPTPFSPTTQALDDALDSFEPLPLSESQVLAICRRVDEAAKKETRNAKISERATRVISKFTQLVPTIFGVGVGGI